MKSENIFIINEIEDGGIFVMALCNRIYHKI